MALAPLELAFGRPLTPIITPTITTALLENGQEVPYDQCSSKRGAHRKLKGFKYIGSGRIYSIDRVLQKTDLTLYDFYVFGEEEKEKRKFNRYTALTNRDK